MGRLAMVAHSVCLPLEGDAATAERYRDLVLGSLERAISLASRASRRQ